MEKSLFLNIITEHYNVIESIKTDGVNIAWAHYNMKMKNTEWVKNSKELAAASFIYSRDSSSLKTLWKNLKSKAKFAIAA